MADGIKMEDGTICRAGVNCKRHGLTASLSKQISTLKREQLIKDGSQPAGLQGRGVRRGINSVASLGLLQELDAESELFRRILNDNESNSLKRYSRTSYLEINAYLRYGEHGIANSVSANDHRMAYPEEVNNITSSVLHDIKNIDSAFAKKSNEGVALRVLYKAFRVRPVEDRAATNESSMAAYVKNTYKIGEVITEKAYNSVSADSDYMLAFCRRRSNEVIVHEILSSKGIPLHEPNDNDGSNISDSEREILLPRNMKLKVVNVMKSSYESSYTSGRPHGMLFSMVPKKKTFTVIQMVEVD